MLIALLLELLAFAVWDMRNFVLLGCTLAAGLIMAGAQRFFHRLPILQSAAAGACVQEAGHVRLRILRQGSQHRVMLRQENQSNRIEL